MIHSSNQKESNWFLNQFRGNNHDSGNLILVNPQGWIDLWTNLRDYWSDESILKLNQVLKQGKSMWINSADKKSNFTKKKWKIDFNQNIFNGF